MARHSNRLFGFADLLQQRQAFGLDLQGPFSSPFDVDPLKQLVLYYLPAAPQG